MFCLFVCLFFVLNVLGVLDILFVLNVLGVLDVVFVLNVFGLLDFLFCFVFCLFVCFLS